MSSSLRFLHHPTLAAFQTERIETLQQVVEALEAMYRAGRAVMPRLLAARDTLVKEQIELATTHSERLALRKRHLDLAGYAEKLAETRFRDGRGSQVDLLQAKALRLKREIALLRETDG